MREWMKALGQRVRTITRRRQLEEDLHDELSFHLEMREQQLLRNGARDPHASARRRFGNETRLRDDLRDVWTFVAFERLVSDIRFGIRSLRKKPGFTAVVVMTLAIGIGANSAVFSAIDAILLRPLPFPNGDQLMTLEQFDPKNPNTVVAPTRLSDWDRLNSTFQAISGYYTEDVSETSGELPEKVTRAWVAPKFFQVWGVYPSIGRAFEPQEETYRGLTAVVVSDRFWRRRFGSDPAVLGKKLRLERASFTIVGVMPASFLFQNREVDVWTPSPLDAPYAQSRESTWFITIGRLRASVTLQEARADLSAIQSQLAQQYPKTDGSIGVRIEPLKQQTVAKSAGSLWMLFASVSVLLLIACTNIAALLLARSADREQEISIRLSIGASRGSVMRRLLAEVFLLALAGSMLGLLVAAGTSGLFNALAKNLPRVEEIRLNWTLVAYSFLCAVGATFICGLGPAARIIHRSVASSLAHSGRSLVSTRSPLQWVLVGIQISLSVTLLAGAGLLVRSFQELGRVSPGFEIGHVLTFRISANWAETTDLKVLWRRIDGIIGSLATVPGVEAAATTLAVPGIAFEHPAELRIVERQSDPARKIFAHPRLVSEGYFETMRIPLLAGELCRAGEASMSEVLVNRSFADTYSPGSSLVGLHIENVPPRPYLKEAEIRGLVGDAREEGLNQQPAPTVYWCDSAALPSPLFVVRTAGSPGAMVNAIRAKVHELEPARSVYDVVPLQDRLDESLAENRLRTVLLSFFAVTAVSLACLGAYGTLSYFVSVRRREVGLRIALGAKRTEIATQFFFTGMRVCIVSGAVGLGLALAAGRALSAVLYGVSPSDPTTLITVLLLVFFTAGVSSLVPAVRAARVNPMQVLREE